jgi:hypothetical protein
MALSFLYFLLGLWSVSASEFNPGGRLLQLGNVKVETHFRFCPDKKSQNLGKMNFLTGKPG